MAFLKYHDLFEMFGVGYHKKIRDGCLVYQEFSVMFFRMFQVKMVINKNFFLISGIRYAESSEEMEKKIDKTAADYQMNYQTRARYCKEVLQVFVLNASHLYNL